MDSRPVHQLESCQAAQTRLEMLPGEFNEALTLCDRSGRRRVDHVVLGGGRRESKDVGEPVRIESCR